MNKIQIYLSGSIFLLLLISCNQKPQTKNILFILADDYGYNDMSLRNSSFYETPNIDNLAKEGMIFNDGYAACQVCSPSRASIMSGKSAARHGITDWIGAETGEEWRKRNRHNKLLPPDYIHNLPHEYTTLPEALKQEGYKTFFAGKWHLGKEGSWPEDHGFDVNIGGWTPGSPWGGYFSPFQNPKLENKEDGENLSMRLANETVKFIRDNKEDNFFAFLSFYAVHGPIQTTQEKWAKYREKAERNGIKDRGFEMGHFLPIRQTQDNPIYAGLVESMDDAVGTVLDALKEMGLDENTIVIFTSDNGGVAAGDNFSTSNQPLRGGKGYQFEGGIREPYFIKVPWLNVANKQSNTPVSGTDFYPTILDLLGMELKPEEHADGVSLLPLLMGEEIENRPLIWHYPHYGNQGGEPSSIIRLGDWKLIHYYEDNRNELYNLRSDLEETHDVSKYHLNLVKELKTNLFDYLEEVGARFPVKDPLYSSELEAEYLKYISTERIQKLEKQRLEYLSTDFDPKNNWWGSDLTKD
ncbi:sulfatase [Tamlana agarivorans]|uniref:Sulfatase n=1 Tax=Pseudotamlana agarivorans TaxID=481183 RepID=A0ACC5U4S6_9FLAO|nr:sulfatase [Tamlana agarivorans]MBU2949314.1 sulfatase [Tamlana agarivorans]